MPNKGMTVAVLCCIMLWLQEASTARGAEVAVTVKENRHLTFPSIEKVEAWGIVVRDNGSVQTILYKVIERIELPDTSLIGAIKQHVPTITVSKIDGCYVLDFKHAEIPLLTYRERRIIDLQHVPLALRLDPVETFEAGLVYSLWPLHVFQHHFSFSTGLPYSEDPSYHVMALNYGIGTSLYRAPQVEFLYHIYFHFKVMERTHGFASTFFEMNTFSIEPQALFFPGKRAFPSVSLRYYFDNFEIDNGKRKLIFIAALNIKLGKAD